MNKLSVVAMSVAFFLAAVLAAHAEPFDHSPWDRELKKFVTEKGRVDYAAWKKDSEGLDAYVMQLAGRSPESHPQDFPSRESRLAYWINAYNALVVAGVLEEWPVRSVTKIGLLPHSFFWRKKFIVGGEKRTLNNIEKDFLLKKLAEPRIHFAIVCASNSCPLLKREAFTPENTERLLEEGASFFINDPLNIEIGEIGKIDSARNRVTLNRIFDWYRGDFEDAARSKKLPAGDSLLLAYVKHYADAARREALEKLRDPDIKFSSYDWGINDVNAPEETGDREK